jgi:peptidoglycan/LPS O-acetylase OafA/YrhL
MDTRNDKRQQKMSESVAAPARRENDNFALLRLVMSVLVLLSHFKVLTGGQLLQWLPMAGDWRVASFFVVSGYVITASYERAPRALEFYSKRFFRIYPLYAFMIFIQAFGMSLFFLDDLGAQLGSIARYLGTNLVMLNFLQYDIGGLLKNAPNPGINASLWTLKVEVMFYLSVPLLFWWFKRFRGWGLLLLFVLSTAYAQYMIDSGHEKLSRQFPGTLRFIVAGMALYYYRAYFTVPRWAAILICSICLPLMQFRDFDLPAWLMPFLTAPLIIMCATKLPVLPQPKVDLSYGMYLMHAPLIQFALLTGLFSDSYWFLAVFIIVVAILAYIGNKLIEMPGLNAGRHVTRWLVSKWPRAQERVVRSDTPGV